MADLFPAELVLLDEGQLYTTSLIVAKVFGKSHYNVLRDIERRFSILSAQGMEAEELFTELKSEPSKPQKESSIDLKFEGNKTQKEPSIELKFEPNKKENSLLFDDAWREAAEFLVKHITRSFYIDTIGRKLPMYKLDRFGFAELAMSYSGEKALALRCRILNRFERMERELQEQKALTFAAAALSGGKRQSEMREVIELHRQGVSRSEIARRTGVPSTTVLRWLRRIDNADRKLADS